MDIPSTLPLLPIRNTVLFPGISLPLMIGRPNSIGAINEGQKKGNLIVVAAQRIHTTHEPNATDIYKVGTLCKIDSVIGTESGSFQVVVTGILRYRIVEFNKMDDHFTVRGETLSDTYGSSPVRTQALMNSLKELGKQILDLLPSNGESLSQLVEKIDDASYLSNLCAAYLNLSIQQKQSILENILVESRIETLLNIMKKEKEVLSLQKDIQEKISEKFNKAQRDAILREQLKTIREELGDEESSFREEMIQKIETANLPDEIKKICNEELKRLENLPSASAEYHIIRTYLGWLLNVPWKNSTRDILDIKEAKKILDEDHFGLLNVKKRILEYLAVAKLKNDLHGPILCLVGPPGVGKTSLGQSIARALGKKFIRASLGGVRDESEIRGHRRTYIGAMPGRIIQNLRRAGVNNPLFMLDEIDKLGISYQGDPASAMLEVLDPEQNRFFIDHYLDVPFDLSNIFFIATANVIDTIPTPLRDRMETIEITGYTTAEKLHIAKNYLLPKQINAHGLNAQQLLLFESTIESIIVQYTREAGVRELQRNIATICRFAATEIVEGKKPPISINKENLWNILGSEKFFPELAERSLRAGIVTGLAWTPHGGDILFIESSLMPGSGKLTLTGQLGEVMKESAHIALSYARSQAALLASHLPSGFAFEKQDIHIHVPAGAIPKDGPSAGIAILSSLLSLLTGQAISPQLAMTGEITLRGAILAVGGIKEKILAAHRAGVTEVVLPMRNKQDLKDIPHETLASLKISFIDNIEEILPRIFQQNLQKVA